MMLTVIVEGGDVKVAVNLITAGEPNLYAVR